MKSRKSEVDYSPAGDHPDRCGACEHFQPPHSCTRVEGSINRDYWCKLFAKYKGKS